LLGSRSEFSENSFFARNVTMTPYTFRMCAHYESTHDKPRLKQAFGIDLPSEQARRDVWPGYLSTFLRRHPHDAVGDEAVPPREGLLGSFGLIPSWSKDTHIARHTYNARSETVASKPSFRDAWHKGQHCIVPIDAFFEPDWRTGKALPTRICLASGEPMGAAGLWAAWKDEKGKVLHSFTLLTINADAHPLMNQLHKSADEKRMIVILPPERYDDWLQARPQDSWEFLQPILADRLVAQTVSLPQSPSAFERSPD
jgi:putative SOS response-associated peptidase YedK